MPISRWIAVCGIVTCLLACSPIANATVYPNLSLVIPRIDAPKIDGSLSDAGWLQASLKGGKLVVDVAHTGNVLSDYPRVAYIGYDDVNLYIACVIYAPDTAKLVGDRLDWWENDEIELFVDPGQQGVLKQYGITSAGAIHPADSFEAAINKEGIRWVVEAAIPFSDMPGGVAPKQGDKWGLNITGHQIAVGDTWVAWNCTFGGFHNTSRFGVVTFGD